MIDLPDSNTFLYETAFWTLTIPQQAPWNFYKRKEKEVSRFQAPFHYKSWYFQKSLECIKTCICICLAFSNSRTVASFLLETPASCTIVCLGWALQNTSIFKIIEFHHSYQNLTTNCLILHFLELYLHLQGIKRFSF